VKAAFRALLADVRERSGVVSVCVNVETVPRPPFGVGQHCHCNERRECSNKLEVVVVEWDPLPVREVGGVFNLEEVPQYARDVHTDASATMGVGPYLNVGFGRLDVGTRVGET
jgi:hypothetical protein